MNGYPFLFWSYLVIWLGIAGYLLFVWLRLRAVDRRLDRHEQEDPRERGQAGR